MKISVVRENGTVVIDGKGYTGIDISSMPANVSAMQWDGTSGEEEYFSDNNGKPANSSIVNLDGYSLIIENWNKAKTAEQQVEANMQNDSANDIAEIARVQRNYLLRQCDWTQFADVDPSISALWKPYRQALRDITNQSGFPNNIDWPVEP